MKKKLLAAALALAMTPALPAFAAGETAYPATQTVEVDGQNIQFQMYALVDAKGNGTNYVKLRDVAHVLNGTAAQFSVGFDRTAGTISVTTGAPYQDTGTEMQTPFSGERSYQTGSGTLLVDGTPAGLEAIVLVDDQGGGYTYFKLRDLGAALGFTVGWTRDRGVFLETGAASPGPETPAGTRDIEVTSTTTQWGTGYYVADNGFGTGKLNNGKPITEANVLELLAEAEKIWPTGMTWTDNGTYNNHWYQLSGDIVDSLLHSNGYNINSNFGCGGFAAIVSDYVFGQTSNPFHRVYDETDLRPGDIVVELIDSETRHILFVTDANNGNVAVGNGNVNSLVKWNHGNLSKLSATNTAWNYLNPGHTRTFEFWSRYPD